MRNVSSRCNFVTYLSVSLKQVIQLLPDPAKSISLERLWPVDRASGPVELPIGKSIDRVLILPLLFICASLRSTAALRLGRSPVSQRNPVLNPTLLVFERECSA